MLLGAYIDSEVFHTVLSTLGCRTQDLSTISIIIIIIININISIMLPVHQVSIEGVVVAVGGQAHVTRQLPPRALCA